MSATPLRQLAAWQQLERHHTDVRDVHLRDFVQSYGAWVYALLFLIIEMVALSMGLALARSITSSIHELFMGTERVRHGDFAHRIEIATNDQLGELAGSFNQTPPTADPGPVL